jgi:hypothetical protein
VAVGPSYCCCTCAAFRFAAAKLRLCSDLLMSRLIIWHCYHTDRPEIVLHDNSVECRHRCCNHDSLSPSLANFNTFNVNHPLNVVDIGPSTYAAKYHLKKYQLSQHATRVLVHSSFAVRPHRATQRLRLSSKYYTLLSYLSDVAVGVPVTECLACVRAH